MPDLRWRLKGLLLLHKIRASSPEMFRLIFFLMGFFIFPLGEDSAIQAPRLLTTSSQGALFLSQRSIKTGTIVLTNTYAGTSVTIMILKHPADGMSINRYTQKNLWDFSLELREQ